MPATMAGSRGGAKGKTSNKEMLGFAERLLTGRILRSEVVERLSAVEAPRTVTLVVNNSCNLACSHCYLQVEKLTSRALNETEWRRVIDSVVSVGPELLCFSGKEVFLGDRGMRLLGYASASQRNAVRRGRLGVITNGTLVTPHRDAILAAAPSYFDISLDGLEAEHDAVRGRGAFSAAWPNVLWAAENFGEAFFINLTLQKRNLPKIQHTIAHLNANGVTNVELGFYIPLTYTDPDLALSIADISSVFKRLEDLESIALRAPLKVHLDLDISTLEPLIAFLGSQWFSFNAVNEDLNGELFVEHKLQNGLLLEIRFAPYPVGISRSVRITPEGNYLAAEDTVDTTKYVSRRIGNVRDFEYDFAALHAQARSSTRFRAILQDYLETALPRLQAAVGCGQTVVAATPVAAA